MKPETVYNKLELEMVCQVKLSMLELCLKNESKNIDPLFIDRYKKEFLENCDKLNTLDLPLYTTRRGSILFFCSLVRDSFASAWSTVSVFLPLAAFAPPSCAIERE